MAARTKARTKKAASAKSPLTQKSGWLSLWGGQFDSLDALEMHIDSSEFEKQHGFAIAPPLLPFNAFLDDASPEQLARQFFENDALVAKVVRAIGDLPTNSLLLHEHCAFDASLSPRGKKRMRFLGSWPQPKSR